MADFKDKTGALQNISERDYVVLELGPGTKKKYSESIAVDRVELEGVDIIADFSKNLSFLPSNSVDHIYSRHVLEHVPDLEVMMREISRILKPGGKCEIIVPHFSNPYFYSDYTHNSFWGLYTICYFSKDRFFKRTTPTFYQDIHFSISSIKLGFSSPFFFRDKVKKAWGLLFNSCKYLQEFYEENLCQIFPCYEIFIEIKKAK